MPTISKAHSFSSYEFVTPFFFCCTPFFNVAYHSSNNKIIWLHTFPQILFNSACIFSREPFPSFPEPFSPQTIWLLESLLCWRIGGMEVKNSETSSSSEFASSGAADVEPDGSEAVWKFHSFSLQKLTLNYKIFFVDPFRHFEDFTKFIISSVGQKFTLRRKRDVDNLKVIKYA